MAYKIKFYIQVYFLSQLTSRAAVVAILLLGAKMLLIGRLKILLLGTLVTAMSG